MVARIIDGRAVAAELRGKVTDAVQRLARDHGLVPGLAGVLDGSDPASEVYVASKSKTVVGSGMRSFDHRLPEATRPLELLALVRRLNTDAHVHGMLVRLPLREHIDPQEIIAA